ncbi:MAG: ATP-binding protein [Bacteroidetes bacterium]|nr:ATP-binding protein [Bacteroidota bacterium]
MIRVAITGPESCGKTSLAEALAAHYKTTFVPEYSREFLMQSGGKYSQEDLDTIATGQQESIQNFTNGPLLISDTDMIVMYIWSVVVYGKASPLIQKLVQQQVFDLYILCDTDVPWTYDPLRENEYDRDELFKSYYKKMRELNLNFIIVRGAAEERLQAAVKAIDTLKVLP